ncbi:MAG: nucleic acid-binding protein [Chloroflexota bacterium]|nr:nucleic acid-binding protein [Chloroflexota bacterium]MDE2682539.1 nucleic acid-binding protein [Chloroflexota bacterium]
MNDYFADSGYWIALITPGDEFHSLATEYDALLQSQNDRIVTTQLVLNETLAPRSGSSAGLRRAAVDLIDRIIQDPRVSIIPQSPEQFDEAFAMFRTVADDKE